MAYAGYLLKVGNFTITGEKIIQYGSYEVTKEVQDMDAYRDANGVLHRNTLPNVPNKVSFSTNAGLTNDDIRSFFGSISENYTIPIERKASVTAYVPETDDYVTQDMYMAGPTLKIKSIDQETNTVKYDSFKISFIGY